MPAPVVPSWAAAATASVVQPAAKSYQIQLPSGQQVEAMAQQLLQSIVQGIMQVLDGYILPDTTPTDQLASWNTDVQDAQTAVGSIIASFAPGGTAADFLSGVTTFLALFGLTPASVGGATAIDTFWTAVITDIINPLNTIETQASNIIGTIDADIVSGVQGISSILTTVQNTWDSWFSALTSSSTTGNNLPTVTQALQTTAQNANNGLSTALTAATTQMQQTAAKAAWHAFGDVTADVTFPVGPTYALASMPTISVTATDSAIGYIVTSDNVDKLSVMFVAEKVGTVTGVYINVYSVGSAGLCTKVIAGSNIVGLIGTVEGVVYDDFAAALPVTPGEQYAVEVVVTGSGSLTMMGLGASWAPTNGLVSAGEVGGLRTGTLTTVPTTFTPTASTSIPFFGLSANGGTVTPIFAPETTSYYGHGTYTYTLPAWFRLGTDYLDVITVGPGGGGGGGLAGAGSAGTNGSVTVTTSSGSHTLTATAGAGGISGTTSAGSSYGLSPGNYLYLGTQYYGGTTVIDTQNGSAPGGGGGGGSFSGLYGYAGECGDWNAATYQPTSATVAVVVGTAGAPNGSFGAAIGADGAVFLVARQA